MTPGIRKLCREAADPETSPTRLVELTRHEQGSVAALAQGNPALPEATLRHWLNQGSTVAWGSPLVPLLLLTGIDAGICQGAQACCALRRAAPEVARSVVRAWWRDEPCGTSLGSYLKSLAAGVARTSTTYQQVGLLTCLLTRAIPGVPPKILPLVDAFETWLHGDRRGPPPETSDPRCPYFCSLLRPDPSGTALEALVQSPEGEASRRAFNLDLATMIRSALPACPFREGAP